MSSKLSVLLLGGTGYIGGSVLVELTKLYPEAHIVTLVRNPADNAAFGPLKNVEVVNGSLTDLTLIEKLASEHDVVVNIADCDTLPLIKAILAGLKTRAKSGVARKPIFIHTSGTGLLVKDADGAFHDDKVYDDSVLEDIKSIPEDAIHRNVDLEVLSAGNSGLIDTYIVAPSTVYGKGRGPLPRLSIQVNGLIRLAFQRKEVLQAGAGTNVWNSIHIDDLANLYALLFAHAISGNDRSTDHFERFYWASGEEFSWGKVATELGKLLYARGLVESPEPKSSTVQEEPALLWIASNSRAAATRGANTFGWKLQGPSLWETLPHEIEWTLADFKAKGN